MLWQLGVWKDAHPHLSLRNCKFKQQWAGVDTPRPLKSWQHQPPARTQSNRSPRLAPSAKHNGHFRGQFSHLAFPRGSAGKESACNAGDPGSIPGSGRSAGKGIGYPLQYSWASLVVQLVKNSLAMRETWVQSLGLENPLEKGKATHSSILAWRIPWTV